MVLVCNVCQPEDWQYDQKGVMVLAKWYPAGGFIAGDDGAYYMADPADKGQQIADFLSEHQHKEVASEHYKAGAGQENPVRLEYESTGLPSPKSEGKDIKDL